MDKLKPGDILYFDLGQPRADFGAWLRDNSSLSPRFVHYSITKADTDNIENSWRTDKIAGLNQLRYFGMNDMHRIPIWRIGEVAKRIVRVSDGSAVYFFHPKTYRISKPLDDREMMKFSLQVLSSSLL